MDEGVEMEGLNVGSVRKHHVHLEVVLTNNAVESKQRVEESIRRFFQTAPLRIIGRAFKLPAGSDPILDIHVESVIASSEEECAMSLPLLSWDAEYRVSVIRLSDEGAADDDETGPDGVPSFKEWELPAREFHGQWESLHYDIDIKSRLLRYAETALFFSDQGVDSALISWNRVVLLHGPPGTGKTSLCQALAHKLAVRLSSRFTSGQLVEVNAHSLFSKWFSESGKLVSKLFGRIQEMVEEEDVLVFVLIDEVESLTAARKAAVSGSEPSDAIRAVNALLTQLDALRKRPNVMLLTTSNITEAVDLAFVDRADIKAFIGHPNARARYEILRSCVEELERTGVVEMAVPGTSGAPSLVPFGSLDRQVPGSLAALLGEAAARCEGFSGRLLRKLPFLAFARAGRASCMSGVDFMHYLLDAIAAERSDRAALPAG